ncbi:MAG: Uma2 family endonuclease [Candidatus Geothermincolia bacterium]
MAQVALKRDARYTYADYLQWSNDERWELINGVAYNITPAPSINHQRISRELLVTFATFLKGKKCEVFDAPFDVRLPAPGESDETTNTVVQPDLVVVCDPSKLDDRGCKGAPDLVIEILSPDSVARDQKEKFLLYEQAGVLEYWLVHPTDRIVTVFHRGADGAYGRPAVYTPGERIRVGVLPDLEIEVAALFGG